MSRYFGWGALLCAGAASAASWNVGIWAERTPDRDTARVRAWADSLVRDFSGRVDGGARLGKLVFVPSGALPLAGGEAHFHPDLRDTALDAAWGLPASDSLDARSARAAERAWLSIRGCPDERNFAVGWDLFRLPDDPSNKPDSIFWRRDAHHYVRFPTWSEVPDSGLDPACVRALRLDPPRGRLKLFSVDTLRRRLGQLVPRRLEVSVTDQGRPAPGAILEIWRAKPDARRSFAARLEGRPDAWISDTTGTFPLRTGLEWLTGDTLAFGAAGSNAVSYWRVKYRRKQVEGWMDATDLARLADDSGLARIRWELPGGSSGPWKEASEKWPHGWLAAQADSSGILVLGISAPEETDYVLRIVDARGREFLRARPVHLVRGVHERILSPGLPEGWWDIRLDGPSERWQVRVRQPPRKGSTPRP
jgi:hypothetical protein